MMGRSAKNQCQYWASVKRGLKWVLLVDDDTGLVWLGSCLCQTRAIVGGGGAKWVSCLLDGRPVSIQSYAGPAPHYRHSRVRAYSRHAGSLPYTSCWSQCLTLAVVRLILAVGASVPCLALAVFDRRDEILSIIIRV